MQFGRPLQNRVLSTGEIVAIPERGTRMSNRGRMHLAGPKARCWERNAWITFLTE
jgi:hypothetical protein